MGCRRAHSTAPLAQVLSPFLADTHTDSLGPTGAAGTVYSLLDPAWQVLPTPRRGPLAALGRFSNASLPVGYI